MKPNNIPLILASILTFLYSFLSAEIPADLLKKAEAGDVEAQFEAGKRLDSGQGVKPDAAAAALWYYKASRNGHAKAAEYLSIFYEEGIGVKKDLDIANRWKEIAEYNRQKKSLPSSKDFPELKTVRSPKETRKALEEIDQKIAELTRQRLELLAALNASKTGAPVSSPTPFASPSNHGLSTRRIAAEGTMMSALVDFTGIFKSKFWTDVSVRSAKVRILERKFRSEFDETFGELGLDFDQLDSVGLGVTDLGSYWEKVKQGQDFSTTEWKFIMIAELNPLLKESAFRAAIMDSVSGGFVPPIVSYENALLVELPEDENLPDDTALALLNDERKGHLLLGNSPQVRKKLSNRKPSSGFANTPATLFRSLPKDAVLAFSCPLPPNIFDSQIQNMGNDPASLAFASALKGMRGLGLAVQLKESLHGTLALAYENPTIASQVETTIEGLMNMVRLLAQQASSGTQVPNFVSTIKGTRSGKNLTYRFEIEMEEFLQLLAEATKNESQ